MCPPLKEAPLGGERREQGFPRALQTHQKYAVREIGVQGEEVSNKKG
jgi:hypothetical protein